MESKKFRDILGAYSSIYEKKHEPEMEEGEEEDTEKDEGGKHKEGKHPKGKEEKGEKVTEKEIEEGFRTIPAGRQRQAMMKRASNLTKQAMTPSKDYADIGDGGKGSPREKAGKINDALRNPKLRKEEFEGDLFDYILEHLVAEGYADTNKAALAIMANMSEEWRDSIVEEVLDEAEGSYGQTPKATAAYGKLANKRRETPASGFAKRGDKTKQVKSAEKHHYRTLNPDAGNRGRKSTKPSAWSGKRSGMTQKDRDEARGGDEYGHTGYDSDFHGGPSAPGGKPKGKKAERQKKTGVSAD